MNLPLHHIPLFPGILSQSTVTQTAALNHFVLYFVMLFNEHYAVLFVNVYHFDNFYDIII